MMLTFLFGACRFFQLMLQYNMAGRKAWESKGENALDRGTMIKAHSHSTKTARETGSNANQRICSMLTIDLKWVRSIHTERKRKRKGDISLMFVAYSLILFACSLTSLMFCLAWIGPLCDNDSRTPVNWFDSTVWVDPNLARNFVGAWWSRGR